MANRTMQVQAQLEGINRLKDGGLSLRFHTQELDVQDKSLVDSYFQQFGWLLFSEQEQNADTLELEAIRKDIGGKTPSKRLRSVIFVLYQQSGRDDLTFEQFYSQQIERFINQVKADLRD